MNIWDFMTLCYWCGWAMAAALGIALALCQLRCRTTHIGGGAFFKRFYLPSLLLSCIFAAGILCVIYTHPLLLCVRGTEQIYEGTVVDRGVASVYVDKFHRESRSYVGIEFENGGGDCFNESRWNSIAPERSVLSEIHIGDRVHIKSAIERKTDEPLILYIEKLP